MASSSRASGRSRKGIGRMDAAIDAMKPFGFETKLVTQTVTQLLKVYGGNGWMFIEECSYSVLIEALLEKQDNVEKENEALVAGEASIIGSPPSSRVEAVAAASQDDQIIGHLLPENETLDAALRKNEPDAKDVDLLVEEGKSAKRRKPYYGWIDDDDDETEDFVELTPADCWNTRQNY